MKLLENTRITHQNFIYIYFYIISELQPESVLDVGLMLQRMGAVSRSAGNMKIPPKTVLAGLSFSEKNFPLYQTIYDHIYFYPHDTEQISVLNSYYELTIFLFISDFLSEDALITLFEKLQQHTSYCLTDASEAMKKMVSKQIYSVKEITIEQNSYFLFLFCPHDGCR